MALSNYNLFANRVLAGKLGAEALRLAWALQRLLLGYGRTEGRLGMTQLRETSRLHGRSLERARDELAAAGVIEFEIGSTGPGTRRSTGSYSATETTALQRTIPAAN